MMPRLHFTLLVLLCAASASCAGPVWDREPFYGVYTGNMDQHDDGFFTSANDMGTLSVSPYSQNTTLQGFAHCDYQGVLTGETTFDLVPRTCDGYDMSGDGQLYPAIGQLTVHVNGTRRLADGSTATRQLYFMGFPVMTVGRAGQSYRG